MYRQQKLYFGNSSFEWGGCNKKIKVRLFFFRTWETVITEVLKATILTRAFNYWKFAGKTFESWPFPEKNKSAVILDCFSCTKNKKKNCKRGLWGAFHILPMIYFSVIWFDFVLSAEFPQRSIRIVLNGRAQPCFQGLSSPHLKERQGGKKDLSFFPGLSSQVFLPSLPLGWAAQSYLELALFLSSALRVHISTLLCYLTIKKLQWSSMFSSWKKININSLILNWNYRPGENRFTTGNSITPWRKCMF